MALVSGIYDGCRLPKVSSVMYDNSHNQMNEPLKPTIIHAASFASPYGGNFIASLRVLAGTCRKEGWAFVLALPVAAAKKDWCVQLIAEGWQVLFLPDKASVLRYAWVLADLAWSSNAALIHTHFSLYDVSAWVASCLLRLRRRKVRVVWHAHSDFPVRMTPLRWVKDVLKYRIMGRTVRIITVSEHLRQQIIVAGINTTAIQTVQNGIDVDRAVLATRPRTQVCKDFKIPLDKNVLLLFGWEPLVKGVDIAMDACERLVCLGLPIVLGIVGTAALREFVAKRTNNAPPSWLYIIPPVENVANLYRTASIFISASRSEGFPYSTGEAMVNQLPVVLSDLPGVSWAHRTSGAMFFPSGDSAALAAAIREVLNWTAEEREQHTVVNDHLIRTEFAVLAWAEQIMRLYREILGA